MKLFVAYRQNALFDQFVPGLLEGLPIVGTFTIPAGTEIKDHQTAFHDTLRELPEDVCFLTDGTCAVSNGFVKGSSHPYDRTVWLEQVFAGQVEKWCGEKTVADNLVWFAKQVAQKREISRVVVVRKNVHDHDFVGSEGYNGDRTGLPAWIGKQLEAGLGASFSIAETLMEAIALVGDDEKAMIVTDRHSGLKDVMRDIGDWYNTLSNWPHNSALLTLPFETTAAQLMERGDFGYSFDIAAMQEQIKAKVIRLLKK